jgi:hypothetical protein
VRSSYKLNCLIQVMKVHFYQISKKSNYVILKEKYFEEIISKLKERFGSIAETSRSIKISKSVLGRYFRKENNRIRIDFMLKIINYLNLKIEEVEKHIIWIGANNSQGIVNPKLPFYFKSREGARFLAAICNEGWISDGAYYSNSEEDLRNSVKNDCMAVFGGDEGTVKIWLKEKDQYLAFPSIIRDVLIKITQFKGIKSENNPAIPSFILEDKELIYGWIEQTIADEGHVNYIIDKYRREIVWRRSFETSLQEYKLNRDEIRMIEKIGLFYTLHDAGEYLTKKGNKKIRKQIRIVKRDTMIKLRRNIQIPLKKKDVLLTEMIKSYERYKEVPNILSKIKEICSKKGQITSLDLRKSMNYKTTNTAIKWLKFFSKKGVLKVYNKSYYEKGSYRKPTIYVLI